MRQQGKFELDVVTYWQPMQVQQCRINMTQEEFIYLFIYLKGKGHMATTMLKNKKKHRVNQLQLKSEKVFTTADQRVLSCSSPIRWFPATTRSKWHGGWVA